YRLWCCCDLVLGFGVGTDQFVAFSGFCGRLGRRKSLGRRVVGRGRGLSCHLLDQLACRGCHGGQGGGVEGRRFMWLEGQGIVVGLTAVCFTVCGVDIGAGFTTAAAAAAATTAAFALRIGLLVVRCGVHILVDVIRRGVGRCSLGNAGIG